ncbi:hypothetical protein [Chromatium okenii]|jgi:hypothetical protein|uniref:hypothetical protein n=1 Tax=Chromatium okenii TaxID=61644 RepID=UPI0026ED00C4|nr:hypothetical protein [Chromatium okenii]MBV5311164.1 hypothetical protein [Chromatium okenii]
MSNVYLYRYTHPDGTAKEWAWGLLENGDIEVRWGSAGYLHQNQRYPYHQQGKILARAQAKCNKGYVFIGVRHLNASGRYDDHSIAASASSILRSPITPVFNFSMLDSEIPDGWF